MDNEIKLTLEAEEPKAPSLTLEGAPGFDVGPPTAGAAGQARGFG